MNRVEAVIRFFEDLFAGDPIALSFLGFFFVVALLFGLVMLKVRRDWRKEAERPKHYGRKVPPK